VTPRRASAALLLLALVPACGGGDDGGRAGDDPVVEPSPPATVVADEVTVQVEAGPESVLTAVVTVTADHPVRPVLTATAEDHRVEVPAPREARRTVAVALVGLRAETTYAIALGGDPALSELGDALEFRTGSLPADLPAIETHVDGDPRPGFTLFNVTPSDLSVPHPGNLVAVDDEGEVVWYHQDSQLIADARQLPDGDLLFNFGNIGARQIDVLGRVVRDWTTDTRVLRGQEDRFGHETYADGAAVVATPRLHHEVAAPLPDGNFLSLSQEVRTLRGFTDPGCPPEPFEDPTVRPERGDLVVAFSPAGRIVHQIALLDAIDPRRQPGSQQCNLKTDEVANGDQVFVDWSHANSATLFEAENAVLVSARNLSSVMALRWEDDAEGPAGEVLWQLGPGLDFTLTEGEWFYRQHAPEVQPDGTILLYDNGSQRPAGPDGKTPAPYSRAVQYRLDRSGPRGTWTARQVWEHRIDTPAGPVYSDFLGDADAIGGDHVLITHGAAVEPVSGLNTALLVEVDQATDVVVLSIRVPSADGIGWQTYRAEHLDTWYPRTGDRPLAGDPPLP
jgi:arylsulfate sulfotransferase